MAIKILVIYDKEDEQAKALEISEMIQDELVTILPRHLDVADVQVHPVERYALVESFR